MMMIPRPACPRLLALQWMMQLPFTVFDSEMGTTTPWRHEVQLHVASMWIHLWRVRQISMLEPHGNKWTCLLRVVCFYPCLYSQAPTRLVRSGISLRHHSFKCVRKQMVYMKAGSRNTLCLCSANPYLVARLLRNAFLQPTIPCQRT